jgi:hypothetical protein
VQVMQTGIAGSWVLQSFEAGDKLVQRGLRDRNAVGRIHRVRIGQAPIRMSRKFQMRFPWLNTISHLLAHIPYDKLPREKVNLPDRQKPHGYKEPDYPYKFVD